MSEVIEAEEKIDDCEGSDESTMFFTLKEIC
jgi:hypothetical protein